MDTKRKFETVIELFKKSFLATLNEEENQRLKELLTNESLERLHEQMKKGKLVEDGFQNQSRYSCQKAFRDFENRTKHQKGKRSVLFRKLSTIAAILIIGITISLLFILTDTRKGGTPYSQNAHVIGPGNNRAQLQLENGDIITLSENPLQVAEKGGINIKYENGTVSYTSEKKDKKEASFNELTVPAGGECYLVFDDGTKVWLNSVTKLKYPTKFSGDERKIYLEGEAYFEVTPGKKPFIVHTSLGEVKVLGTSFAVKAYVQEDVSATLVSGKVVYQGKDTLQLAPGEQVVASPNGKTITRKVDVEEYVGWKNGLYVFNKRSLETIMKDFERWYDVSVNFRDPELKNLLFTGDIDRYDNINTFLDLLVSTEEIRYTIKDKYIELFR